MTYLIRYTDPEAPDLIQTFACSADDPLHAQEQCHDAHPRAEIVALVPRAFVGAYPAALVWADRHHEYPHGEYKRLASMAYADLTLHVEPDCPPELRTEIETHAARIQNQRGEFFPTDACGHGVILGA